VPAQQSVEVASKLFDVGTGPSHALQQHTRREFLQRQRPGGDAALRRIVERRPEMASLESRFLAFRRVNNCLLRAGDSDHELG